MRRPEWTTSVKRRLPQENDSSAGGDGCFRHRPGVEAHDVAGHGMIASMKIERARMLNGGQYAGLATWLAILSLGGAIAGRAAAAEGPSYACDKVSPGSIEEMVCRDAELSALDRKLAGVYAAAAKKATNEHPPVLKAEQRGWINRRDECRKSDDTRSCVEQEYQHRIVELQARYRLVPGIGPVFYACDGNPANEVVVTFFQTDPPTLIAERGDSVSLMLIQPSGSGARYQGRNETFWEHHGEALVTWGHGAPEMHCRKKP